ncbi:hypothetical protein ACHAQA_009584 [Verticillium albo-atrum]
MPKRKRSVDEELDEKLTELKQELFRALKAAKGLERQRLSKRIHEAKSSADKVERLQREVTALKTIDLQETAHAHLSSSLTKIKGIAEHPSLPDDYKNGAPKKELSEQDKIALHNVTSGLYSRPGVREVAEKAIKTICMTLDVPLPEKRARGKKGDKEAKAEVPEKAKAKASDAPTTADPPAKKRRVADEPEKDAAATSDSFNGFSDDENDGDDAGDLGEDEQEAALSKMEDMLGNSDDEEEDVEALRAKYSALLGQQPDIEDADDESDDIDDLDDLEEMDEDDDEDEEEEEEEEQSDEDDQEGMNSDRRKMLEANASPPPAAARKAKEAKPAKVAGSTTFLPSLMGGYFSGSESASDVDVAPRKKRLGQRQRQAIAERKHGEQANHMRNEQKKKEKGGRDDGWDMRRGAVDGDEGGKGKKPWKKGDAKDGKKGGRAPKPEMNRKERRRLKLLSKDDQGTLHPSWEARKKEKEAMQTAAFQGTKITF